MKSMSIQEKIAFLKLQNEKQRAELQSQSSKYINLSKDSSLLCTSMEQRQNRTAPAEMAHSMLSSTVESNSSNASLHVTQSTGQSGNEIPISQIIEARSRPHLQPQSHSLNRSSKLIHTVSPIVEEENPARASAGRSRPTTSTKNTSSPVVRCKSVGDVHNNQKRSQPYEPAPGLSLSTLSISSAMNDTVYYVNGLPYRKLNVIGRGGSSQVLEVIDETNARVVALKIVDFSDEIDEVRQAFINEVELLKSLQGSPNVIVMHDYEINDDQLSVVLEKGDVDLNTFLKKKTSGLKLDGIRYHFREMVQCVKVIHDKNIVHSDLKPANFLFVRGNLKLIDFGIASSIPVNKTSVVKSSQMGTLSYMSPESLSHPEGRLKIPLKSDVWSLGCILYSMVYGFTPFAKFKNQYSRIKAICSEEYEIEFGPLDDPDLLDVLKRCLRRKVSERISTDELLRHPYCEDDTSGSNKENHKKSENKVQERIASELLQCTPNTLMTRLRQMAKSESSLPTLATLEFD